MTSETYAMVRSCAELPRAYASLRFAGPTLSLGKITEAFGEPTISYSKGDKYSIGKVGKVQFRSTSIWLLVTKNMIHSNDLFRHANYLLCLLEGQKTFTAHLTSRRLAIVTMSLFWHGEAGAEAPHLSAEYVERVEACGAKIEEDFDTEDDKTGERAA